MKKLMFVLTVALLALCSTAVFAQSTSFGEITFNIDVATVPIATGAGDLTVTGLSPGMKWAVIPDGAGGTQDLNMSNPPAVPPAAALTAATIDGDPGANILVSFALPTYLVSPSGGQGNIKLEYNGTSGTWGIDGTTYQYFDPNKDQVMTLDAAAGHVDIYIGAIITVPSTVSVTETYLGSGLFTVQYVGM